jgi:excisionase family DNA binding protein
MKKQGTSTSATTGAAKLPARLADLPDVLSVEQLADVLSVCRNGGYAFVNANGIRHFKVGNRILIPKSAVEELLAGRAAA